MVDFDDNSCVGCRACERTCPRHCITMVPNRYGFLYPAIDQTICIQCNLCENRCPINAERKTDIERPKVYAAILKNKEVLLQSSSGGAFSAIADHVIKKGGIVFGSALNEDFEAVHIGISSKEELAQLRGSKYVQSDTSNTYSIAKQELDSGRLVLYTGTPCQIAGLKAFLNKEYRNLITTDLICHGVPSPTFFKEYVTWLEKKLHGKVTDYKFRDKSKNGWSSTGKVFYKNRSKIINYPFDPYYYFFYKGVVCRACCNECKYANTKREGDFTIGDFWGIEKFHPEIKTHDGVSVVMINTQRGLAVFDEISDKFSLIETTIDNACAQNGQLVHPVALDNLREEVLNTFCDFGFSGVVRKFSKLSRNERVIARIKLLIPKPVKEVGKNMLKYVNGLNT